MAKKPRKEAQVETAAVETVETTTAAPVVRTRGPRGVDESAVITVLHDGNPKRAGSKAHAAFATYATGMTVGEYCDAMGKDATPNLVYDTAHGFISIEGYTPGKMITPKEKVAKAPKEPKAPRAKKEKAPKAEADVAADAESALEVQEETLG